MSETLLFIRVWVRRLCRARMPKRLGVAVPLSMLGACAVCSSAWAWSGGFPGSQSSFAIPSAATQRPLGEIPEQTTVAQPEYLEPLGTPFPGNDTLTASQERGMSLGGIGAGSFEINQAGTFGPWNVGNGTHEWRTLPQAAFHVFESDGSSSTTRTLAVNGTGPFTNAFYNEPTSVPDYPSWSP